MCVKKTNLAIHRKVIYAVDSIVHVLNKPGGSTEDLQVRDVVNLI